MRKQSIFLGILIVGLVIISALVSKLDPIEFLSDNVVDSAIRPFLEKELRLPSTTFSHLDQFPKQRQILYVMAGNEKCLRSRLEKASQLFHAGRADRIWVYVQPGITYFDHALGRNLTNKEWAQRQLTLFNIASKDVEFIDVEEGFLGTLSESRTVSRQADKQGYAHVLVVTSVYHTKRVWFSFATFSEESNISFTVFAADDVPYLQYLLREYSKLLVYRYILLPLS